jgi:hypothetical protein
MADIVHNEQTWLEVTMVFRNGSAVATPATARWRFYCETSGTDLTDWADISVPANGEYVLRLPASLLRNISGKTVERKILAAESDYGTDDQVSAEQGIRVANLKKTG